MRRHAVGILAIALLAGAVILGIRAPQDGLNYQFEVNFIRMGALLAVLWLAYADVSRIPAWLWLVFVPLLAILVVRPRWFIYIIPIILLLAVLHPRLYGRRGKRS